MAERYFIQTYGCQMNEYDSAKMADVLGSSLSATKADGVEEADILLVNTCSVREKAEDKVFSLLGRWRELKEAVARERGQLAADPLGLRQLHALGGDGDREPEREATNRLGACLMAGRLTAQRVDRDGVRIHDDVLGLGLDLDVVGDFKRGRALGRREPGEARDRHPCDPGDEHRPRIPGAAPGSSVVLVPVRSRRHVAPFDHGHSTSKDAS